MIPTSLNGQAKHERPKGARPKVVGHRHMPPGRCRRLLKEAEYFAQLTPFEIQEVQKFKPDVWFAGRLETKQRKDASPSNNGAHETKDDAHCDDFIFQKHDHVNYRYELLSFLGKGSYGRVYKAKDHATDGDVAIKMISREDDAYYTTENEVHVLETLRTEGVRSGISNTTFVKMLNSFKFRGCMCIVFELLSTDLATVLDGENLGLDDECVRTIAKDMVQCLQVIFEKNIVHGDLKPANIVMVDKRSPHIKVIDFGLSAYACRGNRQRLVQTVYYRAPEVLLGCDYGVAIDMWSLGCILFELMRGRHLFNTHKEKCVVFQQTNLIGMPPNRLIDQGIYSDDFFEMIDKDHGVERATSSHDSNRYTLRRLVHKHKTLSLQDDCTLARACGPDCDPIFVDFVKRCLVMDPKNRMTPNQAANHPYITGKRRAHLSLVPNALLVAPLVKQSTKLTTLITASSSSSSSSVSSVSSSLLSSPSTTPSSSSSLSSSSPPSSPVTIKSSFKSSFKSRCKWIKKSLRAAVPRNVRGPPSSSSSSTTTTTTSSSSSSSTTTTTTLSREHHGHRLRLKNPSAQISQTRVYMCQQPNHVKYDDREREGLLEQKLRTVYGEGSGYDDHDLLTHTFTLPPIQKPGLLKQKLHTVYGEGYDDRDLLTHTSTLSPIQKVLHVHHQPKLPYIHHQPAYPPPSRKWRRESSFV